MKFHRSTALLVLLLSACGAPGGIAPTAPADGAPDRAPDHTETAMTTHSPSGSTSGAAPKPALTLTLSEGVAGAEGRELAPVAAAAALSASETQAILDRLPPLKEEAPQADFALRPGSLPAPQTGTKVPLPFPPPPSDAKAPDVAGKPLRVVRHAPEGPVELAPHLSVSFDQPMVAITSHDELAKKAPPVTISPAPKGAWRWVGTKTVLFEPDPRFPMATEYKVEVPAGTVSAVGGALEKAETWTFATPPPTLRTTWPTGGPHRRDVAMFMSFDQAIDADAMLASTTVTADGSRVGIRRLKGEELEKDPTLLAFSMQEANVGRWVAFRPEKELPADARVVVTVAKGAPSAEGPRRTEKDQSWELRTYGPMKLTESRCGWGDCRPFTPWTLRFTNPIEVEGFDAGLVTVTPELPGIKVEVWGDSLNIRGLTKGRTKYQVVVSGKLRDVFGQTLGKDERVSFDVGDAPSAMWAQGGPLVVIDPQGKPAWSFYTINVDTVDLEVYRVSPGDWEGFAEWMRDHQWGEAPPAPPGKRVEARAVKPGGEKDELTETRVDLAPALAGGLGHAIVIIKRIQYMPSVLEKLKGRRPQYQRIVAWVQSTKLAVDAQVDHSELVGWVTRLADGAPVEGATVTLEPEGQTATTGGDGIARMALGTSGRTLVVTKGDDVAFLPRNLSFWDRSDGWAKRSLKDALRWYVFDDRGMYKPGEEVRVKGWVRTWGAGQLGDIGSARDVVDKVGWRLRDSRNNEVAKGDAVVDAAGGFSFSLKLTDTMNLGHASLELVADGGGTVESRTFGHSFQVQEFRRPEFEVTAKASEGPHFAGGEATATVEAKYYAGGGLPDADVSWRVTSRPGFFTPPGRGDYTFGTWTPWWESDPGSEAGVVASFAGKTDGGGAHTVKIELGGATMRPQVVTAESSVMDVNRQAWSASASFVAHPASVYVGLRTKRTFVQQGDDLVVEAIVADLDGALVAGRKVTMKAVRRDWTWTGGQWKEEESDPQECAIESANEGRSCTFKAKQGGTVRITATVSDGERAHQSELTVWVAGGKQPPKRDLEQENVTLIPDRETYAAGDTAEVMVQAPFWPCDGLVATLRSGIVKVERIHLDGPTTTIRVPIEEKHVPNLTVEVLLAGAAARLDASGQPDASLPKRPAYARGSIGLRVPPVQRTLALEVEPAAKKIEPGAKTSVTVGIKDAAGKPVAGAQVTLVVVDEAVLALSGYALADPVGRFYGGRGTDTQSGRSRAHVLLATLADLAEQGAKNLEEQAEREEASAEAPVMRKSAMAPMAAMPAPAPPPGGGGGAAPPPIKVRTNFDALATFVPDALTDAAGRVVVPVNLPDNLTRYRVMAVAVAGDKQFGKGESAITARLPLMVRPSPPRFLNFGDVFELPVVLQNQTDGALDVSVAVRASNASLTAGQGRKVTIAANDRVEVRFPAAAVKAGRARFQLGAVTGSFADAAELDLPVWTPATTEAFATYGEIDQGAIAQPVAAPGDVVTQFGGLEISTSSTAVAALTDAVLYLVAYPFECAEQLSSRVLAVAALRDVLSAFKAEGLPPPEDIVAAVARDVERLGKMQNSDGGFGFWRRGDESWPWVSIHVAHALGRAKAKGFDVPQQMIDRALGYLRDVRRHMPSWYGVEARQALEAYALYARGVLGDRDAGRARKLLDEMGLDKAPLESVGFLLGVLDNKGDIDRVVRHMENRATEEAGTAHFATSYGDGAYVLLHSDRRADGILLEALIGARPDSDLIPKVVRGLMAHRTKGRWGNTQENAFVLLALDRYFNTYEKATPDFVARVWLDGQLAGDHQFKGRTTEQAEINIPMAWLAEKPGERPLVLGKEGPGRLYYRLGMRYAPKSLKLDPSDHGFTVERSYEGVDDPKDVVRDGDGTWRVKAGAKVRVRLTMVAPTRRYHVALVDPLPAGLEPMNPALAVTGALPQDPEEQKGRGGYWWWYRTWYEHQNLRDERVEAFTTLLWEGVHTYTYVARATTPGTFVVPPTKAEEMYHPETFGRAGSDRLVVQ
ncbi:MAG: hypothetical protein AMXMBFR64_37240 [Myxococcales bacterium]